MNYKLIHDKTINYIRNINPKDRIQKRNKLDVRLSSEHLYIEVHHIIPRSLGGLDNSDNLVETLPEEHLFLHMLRYKIYRKREDALAVRFMLNGFIYHNKKEMNIVLNKKLRMGYAWLRTHAQFLRKTEGWHTPEGVKKISEARKGKMPVKDVVTGKMIGAVSINHPNILSGLWVHHSKGRKQSEKEIEDKRQQAKGQKNPNASGLTDEYFIEKGLEMFKEFGFILSWDAMIKLSDIRKFKWIKSLRSRFEKKGIKGYYTKLEEITGIKYIPYRKIKIC